MKKTWDYKCKGCEEYHTLLIEDEEKDAPPPCILCESELKRVFTAPNVSTEKLSQTYVDGLRGQSTEWKNGKEAIKLKMLKREMGVEHPDRKAVTREINKLESNNKGKDDV